MLSTHKCLLQQTIRLTNFCLTKQQASTYSLLHLPSRLQVNDHKQPIILNQTLLAKPHLPLLIPHTNYAHKSIEQTKMESTSTDKQQTKLASDSNKIIVNENLTTDTSAETTTEVKPTTYKEKLKQAMAQYGSTVIVFHITISLISLGICYMVVASGLDLSALLEKLGLSEKSVNKLASSSGTFAAAYLVHKVFAPVRLSITLTCTPFIVRYLRKAGIIKKALPKVEPKPKT